MYGSIFKKKEIAKGVFIIYPLGGAAFFTAPLSISLRPSLVQQQNLNDPPQEKHQNLCDPLPHPLYKCKQFKQCSIKELFLKKHALI